MATKKQKTATGSQETTSGGAAATSTHAKHAVWIEPLYRHYRPKIVEWLEHHEFDNDVQELFKKCDANNTNCLTWNNGEIKKFIKHLFSHKGLPQPSGEVEIYNIYREFDTNHSSSLDIAECCRLARHLFGIIVICCDPHVHHGKRTYTEAQDTTVRVVHVPHHHHHHVPTHHHHDHHHRHGCDFLHKVYDAMDLHHPWHAGHVAVDKVCASATFAVVAGGVATALARMNGGGIGGLR